MVVEGYAKEIWRGSAGVHHDACRGSADAYHRTRHGSADGQHGQADQHSCQDQLLQVPMQRK